MNTYHHLAFRERERLVRLFARGLSHREAGRVIGRDHATIGRELKRTKTLPWNYSAIEGDKRARKQRKRPRRSRKIESNERLKKYIHEKLALRWSPEQIAQTLKRIYREDHAMQVSHETIYTYIYVLPRGELRKELLLYLRQKRSTRQRRYRTTEKRGRIPNMISIHERPKEVETRTVPGHWESDLLIGKDHASAMGTLVERTTRTTILVPLKAKDAETVRKAFARVVKRLPKEVMRSLTHDRGSEMSEHELFTKDTNVIVYFADPQSPWQRGTNENTNGLIRQFFPKGTDFNKVGRKEIKYVQKLLNERPREILGWETPKETFAQLLTNGAVRV